jgi:hypothetical protein
MGITKSVRSFFRLVLTGRFFMLLLVPPIILEVAYAREGYRLGYAETMIALIGTTAVFLFLKTSCLLIFHSVVYRSRVEGSPFIVAALVCMLLLIALSAVAYLGASRADDIPASDLTFMLFGSYAFFTIVIWIATRSMGWLFQNGMG